MAGCVGRPGPHIPGAQPGIFPFAGRIQRGKNRRTKHITANRLSPRLGDSAAGVYDRDDRPPVF